MNISIQDYQNKGHIRLDIVTQAEIVQIAKRKNKQFKLRTYIRPGLFKCSS